MRQPLKNKFRPVSGFTLIEVLTALAIAGILLGALGSMLVGGAHVYRLLDSRRSAVSEKAAIELEHLARRIQAAPVSIEIPMKGTADKLVVPMLAEVAGSLSDLKDFKLGQVQTMTTGGGHSFVEARYYYDPESSALVEEFPPGQIRTLIDGIRGVQFSYRAASSASWSPSTGDLQDGEGSAKAIRIRLDLDPELSGSTTGLIEKTFLIFRSHPGLTAALSNAAQESTTEVTN
ncbi:MAG: type II secretion system protein [Candidatus Omnitrophica bacterium]|nr:type II secretion system protein [Candidatus Omnitrophota bacterium]